MWKAPVDKRACHHSDIEIADDEATFHNVPAMKSLIAAVLILGFATPPAVAEDAPQPLLIDGKPASLACLTPFTGLYGAGPVPVDLAQCSARQPNGDVQSKNGMIGFDDRTQGGNFHYRDVGKLDGLDVLYIQWSGGGSGQFTQLIGIERAGGSLYLRRAYASGDRCMGGILSARLQDGHLFYDSEDGPYRMMSFGKTPSTNGGALDWNLSSCTTILHWRDQQVIGARLIRDQLADAMTPDQACFNRFYNSAVARKQAELNKEQLVAFVSGVMKSCALSAK